MSVRMDLVYNPASGNFRPARLHALCEALEATGFAPRIVATTPEGVEIAEDAELVCIHGGDGTVRLVADALGERAAAVPLAIAPVGTINLLARELGYSSNPRRFAAQIAAAWMAGEGSWLRSPLLSCNGGAVLSCLSIGPDSAAVAGVSLPLKARIGRLAYLVAGLALLRRWPQEHFSLRAELADGSTLERRAQAIFVARGRYYAGPFRLSRAARLDSASFELVVLEKAGRLRSLGFALAMAAGLDCAKLGLASVHSVRELQVEGASLPHQIDGDARPPAPLHLAMSEQIIRYCV